MTLPRLHQATITLLLTLGLYSAPEAFATPESSDSLHIEKLSDHHSTPAQTADFPQRGTSIILSAANQEAPRFLITNTPAETIQIALHSTGNIPTVELTAERQLGKTESISATRSVSSYSPEGLGNTQIYEYAITTPGNYMLTLTPAKQDSPAAETLLIIGYPASVDDTRAVSSSSQPTTITDNSTQAAEDATLPLLTIALILFVIVFVAVGAHITLVKTSATEAATHTYLSLEIIGIDYRKKLTLDPSESETFPLLIGRGNSCALTLPDTKVSSRHCEIHSKQGHLYLLDIGSTNGTRLNGAAISPHHLTRLHNGDKISLGQSTITITKILF